MKQRIELPGHVETEGLGMIRKTKEEIKDRFEAGENPCDRCHWLDEVTETEFPCSHCIHNNALDNR